MPVSERISCPVIGASGSKKCQNSRKPSFSSHLLTCAEFQFEASQCFIFDNLGPFYSVIMFKAYLCRILGQCDILLLSFTSIWFHEFYLDVLSLIFTTSAFVKNKNSKMRYLKEFVKPLEVNRTCIGFTNLI